MGGRGATSSQEKTNNKEIESVYAFVEKKGGRYPTIGQNTKAYKYAIDNATDITIHDDSDYDYFTGASFNKPATREDMKQDIDRFDMKLNYVGDNTFRLAYYSGLFYTFKLKR